MMTKTMTRICGSRGQWVKRAVLSAYIEEEQSGEAGEAEPDDLQDDHGTMGHNCPSAEEFNCDPTYRYGGQPG